MKNWNRDLFKNFFICLFAFNEFSPCEYEELESHFWIRSPLEVLCTTPLASKCVGIFRLFWEKSFSYLLALLAHKWQMEVRIAVAIYDLEG